MYRRAKKTTREPLAAGLYARRAAHLFAPPAARRGWRPALARGASPWLWGLFVGCVLLVCCLCAVLFLSLSLSFLHNLLNLFVLFFRDYRIIRTHIFLQSHHLYLFFSSGSGIKRRESGNLGKTIKINNNQRQARPMKSSSGICGGGIVCVGEWFYWVDHWIPCFAVLKCQQNV